MSYNLLTKEKFITTKSQSEIQNNSVSSQVFELVKSRMLNSLDKRQNKDNIKDYFLVLYTSRKVTIVANADIDIENKESVLKNIECDHMNLKLQLDILYNTAKPTIQLNFDDAENLNNLLTSGMIELKQLSGGLYLLTNLTESVVKISNVTTQIENFNNFFTVEMWRRLQNSLSQSNALTLQEAETIVQESLNSTPYINGLIFEDNILRGYAGKDFIPIPADTQILVKLIKCLSNDKTCALLPIMIENCDFNKKNTDRLISDLLCSHEYMNIYPDLKETYNEVLEGKVLKKNYVKKAKKRLFKHLFYFVMNVETLCGTEKDSDGEVLLHYYNEFIQQLLNRPVQNTSITEVVNEDYNFAIHDKKTDNISSNVVSPDSQKEFILPEIWNKENGNFILESTGEQSETDTKTFAPYKQESAIDDVAIGKLKKEFLTLKAVVSNKLSSSEESNKTMYKTHDILVENYKSLYKNIESLDRRLSKLENRLPDYKALEKQNTILEYRLDCLVEKLASGNDHYSSVSRNNEYSIKRQQPMYSHSDDEPPQKVYKSTHDLFQ